MYGRWEEIVDEDRLQFGLHREACQYRGLVASMYRVAYYYYREEAERAIGELIAEDRLDI